MTLAQLTYLAQVQIEARKASGEEGAPPSEGRVEDWVMLSNMRLG